MAWQIALQLVRQGQSDEPAGVADADEAKVEDNDKLGRVVAGDKQTADESAEGKGHDQNTETSVESITVQMDLPDEPAASEVQVADTDEPTQSKVFSYLLIVISLGNVLLMKYCLFGTYFPRQLLAIQCFWAICFCILNLFVFPKKDLMVVVIFAGYRRNSENSGE